MGSGVGFPLGWMKDHLVRRHQGMVMEAEVSKECRFGGMWKSGCCYLV